MSTLARIMFALAGARWLTVVLGGWADAFDRVHRRLGAVHSKLAQIDERLARIETCTTPFASLTWTGGYQCSVCGAWVPANTLHSCTGIADVTGGGS